MLWTVSLGLQVDHLPRSVLVLLRSYRALCVSLLGFRLSAALCPQHPTAALLDFFPELLSEQMCQHFVTDGCLQQWTQSLNISHRLPEMLGACLKDRLAALWSTGQGKQLFPTGFLEKKPLKVAAENHPHCWLSSLESAKKACVVLWERSRPFPGHGEFLLHLNKEPFFHLLVVWRGANH